MLNGIMFGCCGAGPPGGPPIMPGPTLGAGGPVWNPHGTVGIQHGAVFYRDTGTVGIQHVVVSYQGTGTVGVQCGVASFEPWPIKGIRDLPSAEPWAVIGIFQ